MKKVSMPYMEIAHDCMHHVRKNSDFEVDTQFYNNLNEQYTLLFKFIF